MSAIQLTVRPAAGDMLLVKLVPGSCGVGSSEGSQIQLPNDDVTEQQLVLWAE